jgi:hypothetical protein
MRERFRDGSLWVATALLLVLAACSGTTETVQTESAQDSEDSTTTTKPTTTTATAPAEPTSTTALAPATATSTSLDVPILDSSAALAVSFLAARADRDLDVVLTYLDRNVIFEWGPGGTYDTLESVWAWEDAFKLVHSTENCDALNSSGDTTTVLCRLKVDSEVAKAAGNSPGLVCATLAVVDQLITRLAVDAGPECSYRYWPKMFAPFGHWLGTAHPDITIEEMYNDRVSEAGLDLWTKYTQEFLDDIG